MARRLGIAVLAVALGSAPGAAGDGPPRSTEAPETVSDFLAGLPLQPDPKDHDRWIYAREPGVLGGHDAFLVEPALVYLDPASRGNGLEPGKLDELTRMLRSEVVEQLEKGGYRVVTQGAPGVVRIQAAITGVNLSKSGANAATKAAGMALGVGFLAPSVDVGGAAIEVAFVDAVSGEVLAAMADRRRGRRFFNVRSLQRTGDARKAFRQWAKELRQRLEEVDR